jgi:colanic acid/amylovoran biosynthesis glycosyltransferase
MMARATILPMKDLRPFVPNTRQATSYSDLLQLWYRLMPFAGRRWDVVYFPWILTAIYYLPPRNRGYPIVVSCRGSQINVAPHDPKRPSVREDLREIFRMVTAVHCVSEGIKNEAMHYGLDPGKAWVIRPAVAPSFFHPAEHKTEHCNFRVLTAGNLQWQKGYEYALIAIRYLKDQGIPVHFDMIGDGPERQRILYTIYDLGLENEVHLHGGLTAEKVRDQLQNADVFLLSSVSEGISNAVLEAMACGLPVVTTDCGGLHEVVNDGVEGFVVPVREPSIMGAALVKLSFDPGLRAEMGRCARERVVQRFSVDQQINQFITLFRTSLDR